MQSTMGAQAKPDTSIGLTRRNGPRGHLLSTFNKQKDIKVERADVAQPSIEAVNEELDIDAAPMSSSPLSSVADIELSDVPSDLDVPGSSPELVLPSTEVASRPEPGTEDEPISTEEESSDSDAPPRKETNYMTLEQKFAGDKNGSGNSQSRKSRPARTMSAMMGDSDGEEIFSSWGSSQSKRAKPNTYRTKNTYFNRPSFAKATPEKSKPNPNPKAKAKAKEVPVEKKTVEAPTELEDTFIVPKDIENPAFKPETKNVDSSSFGTFSSKENDATQYSSEGDSPLSSTSSSMFKGMKEDLEPRPSSPRKALCPMCKTEVDPEILALFQSQPKQRIREQQQFCESHKLHSAARHWEERGYPLIVWEEFEPRIQGIFPELEKLLVPDACSYYRNILDDILKSGQAKNFRLTLDGERLETITCGYYGTKGASKMLHSVINRFSVRLRRLATTDRIVKTAGVAGYAQCVLVPELAMRLVEQDMNVGEEAARQIMRDSMEIGQRLNPELNDVVPVLAGEEDAEDGESEDLGDLTDLEDVEDGEAVDS